MIFREKSVNYFGMTMRRQKTHMSDTWRDGAGQLEKVVKPTAMASGQTVTGRKRRGMEKIGAS
jgi:hypothetical protein